VIPEEIQDICNKVKDFFSSPEEKSMIENFGIQPRDSYRYAYQRLTYPERVKFMCFAIAILRKDIPIPETTEALLAAAKLTDYAGHFAAEGYVLVSDLLEADDKDVDKLISEMKKPEAKRFSKALALVSCVAITNHLKDLIRRTCLVYQEGYQPYHVDQSVNAIVGFFVYHPFLKNIRAYKYIMGTRSVEILGQDDLEDTIHVLQKVPKELIFDIKGVWGFLLYSERKSVIVCKIAKASDINRNANYLPNNPRGTPGTIVSERSSGNETDMWNDKGPYRYLTKHFKHRMEQGKGSMSESPEPDTKLAKNIFQLYAKLVELFMWNNDTMFSQELAWWGFLKRP